MAKAKNPWELLQEQQVEGLPAKRVEALRKPLRGVRVLAGTLDGSLVADEWHRGSAQRGRKLQDVLHMLSAKVRREMFEAAFPGMGTAMETAWLSHVRRPVSEATYHESGTPFRAPGNEQLLAAGRTEWFMGVCDGLARYDATPTWLAEWIGHLGDWNLDLAWLLAGVLDTPGEPADECLGILRASAAGEHAIGEPSKPVIAAMMICERREAWAIVEGLLRAAKREEGLRQSILEAADAAHPGMFRRLLRVILDENLVRFSSVVRAADVWFGLQWDSMSSRLVHEQIGLVLEYLEDPGAREAALRSSDGNAAYLALWATAFDDLDEAAEKAGQLLKHDRSEMRFAAVHLLVKSERPHLMPLIVGALGDADLRVAVRAADYFRIVPPELVARRAAFGPLEALFERVRAEKPGRLKEIIWPWTSRKVGPPEIGTALVRMADSETAERLVEHLALLEPSDRATVAEYLGRVTREDDEGEEGAPAGGSDPAGPAQVTARARAALVELLGDSADEVRRAAFRGLSGRPVEADEAAKIESLMDRKNSALRTSGLGRLAEQTDAAALASAERLLGDRNAERRRAGAELLESLARTGRGRERISAFLDTEAGRLIESDKRARIGAMCDEGSLPRLGNCLGLIDVAAICPALPVVDRGYAEITGAAVRLVLSLEKLIEANKELPVPEAEGEEESTLGAAYPWRFRRGDDGMLFAELWRSWNAGRGPDLRDPDGCELTRALLALQLLVDQESWPRGFRHLTGTGRSKLRYKDHVEVVLNWLLHRELRGDGWPGPILDSMETAIARGNILASWDEFEDPPEMAGTTLELPFVWFESALREIRRGALSDGVSLRLWRLYRAVDAWGAREWSPRQVAALERTSRGEWSGASDKAVIPRPGADTVLAAARLGEAGEADLVYHMVHAHPGESWADRGFVTLTHPAHLLEHSPPAWVPGVVRRVVDRIVELELRRGDAVTETTKPATRLERSGGARTALEALARLRDAKLARTGVRWKDDRCGMLSRLILNSRPAEGDTVAAFTAAAAEMSVSEDRLIELAVYAPRWAGHVEGMLKWEGLVDGVWWIHAHTKDDNWRLEPEEQEAREASIAERTPIAADELQDGAVDVAWFGRVYGALGKARWERVYAAAKYACGGAGHKRAQLFADAMLGRTKEKELIARINAKRHQDSIRALGLIPLKSGSKGAVLARYRVMQEVRRTSRKHGGSMLQASEKRAVEIGMENLARTAGYPDPVRLQWAMEREEVADLEKGPVTVKSGPVSVTLAIDDHGAPELTVTKEGKRLASVPPKVKKEPKVAALAERVKQIRQQGSRMRSSLELAMCRGDRFTGGELLELMKHPVLRPMLERLVFVGGKLAGYPDKGGRVLRSHDGSLEPLKAADELRLAHPYDLLRTKAWSRWQRECFDSERVQPFKQVFRELYTLTEREKGQELRSTRYAGHQVQPRQALALLGGRGWVARPEEGVFRTFHAERLTAWLEFDEAFYTPAEVEGLTLEAVRFSAAGTDEPVKLAAVPARLFSEVMRDVDLVVSVAHRGGVDPEASESTVESRASLLRETCRLLKLGNVRVEGTRALVKGSLSDYSVHLGSATVQMMPGGSIWIVPVHAQHRGRLFLPFADQDPKTAEVISKVLLLARDEEIKDPAIREQIAAKR